MMPGINTLLLSTGVLGLGMTLPIYMGPTALRGFRATGDTLPNVESQVFTPYNFGSSRDQTPDLLTTRPTCYHSSHGSLLIHNTQLYTYKYIYSSAIILQFQTLLLFRMFILN